MANLAADRDIEAWQAAMARLDREETQARTVTTPRPSPHEVVASLSDLARLFIDAEPKTQQRIAQALFEEIEVLAPNQVWVYPSPEAESRGWAAAMAGEFEVEVRKTGRGERIGATGSRLIHGCEVVMASERTPIGPDRSA
jgi:hypothetical protein